MQGPTQPREQARDQRESTVVMPRIDPRPSADLGASTKAVSRADQVAEAEPPEFGDPYALPPSRSEQMLTAEPAGGRQVVSKPAPDFELPSRDEPRAQSGLGSEDPVPQHAELEPSRHPAETQSAEPAGDADRDESVAAVSAGARPAGLELAAEQAQAVSARARRAEVEPPAEPTAAGSADARRAAVAPSTEQAQALPAGARPAAVVPPADTTAPSPRAGQAAVLARPARGSMADLQARLNRLPDGHPSALYDEAGRVRPAPTRLRQLELGLPAPERIAARPLVSDPRPPDPQPAKAEPDEAVGSLAADEAVGSLAADDSAPAADDSRPARDDFAAAPDESAAVSGDSASAVDDSLAADEADEAGLARDDTHAASAVLDQDEAPAERPSRPAAEQPAPDPGGNGHSDARADWQDPYAFGTEGGPRLTASSLAGPWPDADAPDSTSGNGNANGHGPRARELDRVATARTPSPQPPVTRRREPTRHDTVQLDTGRRRSPGQPADSSRGPASAVAERAVHEGVRAPQHRELVNRILASCRAAEGQTVFGGYGSSGITPALRRIATQLPAGGLAPGSEDDALKPADRLAAKLARLIARQPGRAPDELAASISDVIRYAFTFATPDYSEGTWLVHRKLKTQGFELEARRNRWDSAEYKGVFTRWRDPAHGVAFEVQFHTVESWAVVKQTHAAYARITDPATQPAERARLRAAQVAATAGVETPPGWDEIADFRSATG